VQYYEDSDLIDNACYQLLSRVGKDESKCCWFLASSILWSLMAKVVLVPKYEAVDVIQISTGDTVYVSKVSYEVL